MAMLGSEHNTSGDSPVVCAPRFAPRQTLLLEHEGRIVLGAALTSRVNEVDGTLVFGDVSGFTALSERLAKQGRVGAELLSSLLTISFTPMLDLIRGLGGDLVSFGGDALCVLFQGESHASRGVAAAHGLRSALRRSASVRAPIDRATLKISTGVHSGPVVLGLVGEDNPTLVTLGSTLSRTLSLESDASGGQVFISHETADRIRAEGARWARVAKLNDTAFELVGIDRKTMPWLSGSSLGIPIDESLMPGIDRRIVSELRSGRSGLAFYQATLAFIHFDGTDELIAQHGAARAVEAIDTLMTAIQLAASREDLTIIGTDVDKDGGKVILAAGLPSSSGLEHDRMLAAIRTILDSGPPVSIKVGVHAGTVFAGPVGSTERAVFTIIGDAVNTTARIMARAQHGEALVSPLVLRGSRTPWSSTPIVPFAAKGKSKPLEASALGSPEAKTNVTSSARLPFIGRSSELSTIDDAISRFRSGTRSVVELVGEGGLGKSRLIDETLFRLAGARVVHINGSPFARTQGYFAVQRELRLAIGMQDSADDSAQFREIVRKVHPEIEPLLPLFGAAFGFVYDETKESQGVAQAFRASFTNRLVLELLRRTVGPSDVVLVVDDSHWLDEATCSLVAAALGSDDLSWFVLVARRPEHSSLDLTATPGLVRIELSQLDDESAVALALEFARSHPLTDEVIRAAVQRASGNPLLLELVLEALRSGSSMSDLPEEAERLVAARLDALTSDDRDLLRAASILGMDVSSALLAHVLDLPLPMVESRVQHIADYLLPDSLGAYRFRHALVRETAYEGLAFSTRRRLHASVVDAIEHDVPHVGERISLLAIHSAAAGLHTSTWRYAREAAHLAQKRGLLSQAAELLHSTLASARYVDDATDEATAEVVEMLADVDLLRGKPLEAQRGFRFLSKRQAPTIDRCRILRKLADAYVATQRYSTAERTLTQGLKLLDHNRSAGSSHLTAELLLAKAAIENRRGRYIRSIRVLNEAWAAGDRSGDDGVRGRINYFYGTAETALGSRHAEYYLTEAVRILRSTDRRVELAKALSNLGYFSHFNGLWSVAIEHYEESVRVADACGDLVTAANNRNNVGEILSDRGDLDGAEQYFSSAQRAWSSAGYTIGNALILSNLGRLAGRRFEFAMARELLSRASDLFHQIGAAAFQQEAQARIAEVELADGNVAKSLELCDALLKSLPPGNENPSLEVMLLRIRGVCQLADLDPTPARLTLNRALSLAEAFRCRWDQLAIASALVTMGEESPEYRLMVDQLSNSLGIRQIVDRTAGETSALLALTRPNLCESKH